MSNPFSWSPGIMDEQEMMRREAIRESEAVRLQSLGKQFVGWGSPVPFIYPSQEARFIEWGVPYVLVGQLPSGDGGTEI